MQNQEVRSLYFTQKIRNLAYNFKYKAIGLFQQYKKQGLLAPCQRAYILGRTFQATNDNVQEINKTIWITYRAGFPQLPDQLDGSYVTDTGWGCMIRVGQMLYAQILKEHISATNMKKISQIVSYFNDFDKNAIFSIQNIARIARIQYGLKPGSWYNPSQIAYILSQLFRKKPLESYSDLSFKVFNSGNLFFDQMIQIMSKNQKKCQCQLLSGIICLKCNTTKKSLAVIVLSRIGLQGPQPKYISVLNRLIQSKHFQGVIGGKPQKALYFVGRHLNEYIYLDPHYVQQAKKQIKQQSDSYFCGSFRKCKNTSIDPSLGICFYLRNLKELNQFYQFMYKIKSQNQQNFFIFMARQTPSYAKQKIKRTKSQQQDSEYFQQI